MKFFKSLLAVALLSICSLTSASTAYTVDPNVDLVATNNGVTFCIKHVHLTGLVDVQIVILLTQSASGDWVGNTLPASQIDETALKPLGPVG